MDDIGEQIDFGGAVPLLLAAGSDAPSDASDIDMESSEAPDVHHKDAATGSREVLDPKKGCRNAGPLRMPP